MKSHGASRKHKTNAKNIMGTSQPKILFTRLDQLDGARKAEARLSLFVAKHTAIILTDHLVDSSKNVFKCDEAVYLQMHRTKCSAIIQNVLAPHFAKKLCDDIADYPFSLLLDESTDITTDKYLGCTIIYYSYDKKKL